MDPDEDLTGGFIQSMVDGISRMLKSMYEWVEKWLKKMFESRDESPDNLQSKGWFSGHRLAYLLLGSVVVLLIILIILMLKNRNRIKKLPVPAPVARIPDLSQEDVVATDLADDEWYRMGQSMVVKGDLRLAIRAYYLSILSLLDHRELIHVETFKSNSEYRFELGRRAHAFPGLPTPFDANIDLFEQVWYGMYEVNQNMLERFLDNHKRIKDYVEI